MFHLGMQKDVFKDENNERMTHFFYIREQKATIQIVELSGHLRKVAVIFAVYKQIHFDCSCLLDNGSQLVPNGGINKKHKTPEISRCQWDF